MTVLCFKARRIFAATMLSVALVALFGVGTSSPLHADETSEPKATAASKSSIEKANQVILSLGEQVINSERRIESLRGELGSGHPEVRKAERELEANRKLYALHKEMMTLLAGQRDEKRSAEMDVKQRQQLEAMNRELAAREQALAAANKELAKLERASAMPPIDSGDLKVYTLNSLPAKDAADAIETLFGPGAMRVAVDNRTNSLIVFGKAESLPVIEALLMRLDQKASPPKAAAPGIDDDARSRRSLLLRLFWLADGLPADAGTDPFEVLPESVLRATEKLGLVNPRLITQSVNSLVARSGEGVEFSADVPALLGRQSVRLTTGGKVTLVAPDQVALAMHAYTTEKNLGSELKGSLSVPLGHYMVLGTANSVIPKVAKGQTNDEMKLDPGTGTLVQIPNAEGKTDDPEYKTSRFAFVVQVIDAESFPPEKQ